MSLIHIDYRIDKNRFCDVFWENKDCGSWHHTCVSEYRRDLYWWRILIDDKRNWNKHLLPYTNIVAADLNILGMDNYPRFNYYFPNHQLPHHVDPDNMVAININLLNTIPTIHIEHQPYEYECALIDVGGKMHGIEPDANPRLILKFCLRHPWEEVYERLDKIGLITSNGSEKV